MAAHFDKFFANCKSLERLKVSSHGQKIPPSAIRAIKTCLDLNKQLKKLNLSGELLFNDDFLSTISCKLTELDVSCYEKSPHTEQNLNLFLMAQSESLESLEVHLWTGHDVMKTILSMPRLKKLYLGGIPFDASEYEADDFPQNHSVKNLSLHQYPCHQFKWFKTFLKSFTKVEFLSVLIMTDDIADLIPETCKSVRQLSVMSLQAKNVRESNEAFYVNLEEFKCREVNSRGSKELLNRLNGRLETVQPLLNPYIQVFMKIKKISCTTKSQLKMFLS